jgi:molecular chaperone GrpE
MSKKHKEPKTEIDPGLIQEAVESVEKVEGHAEGKETAPQEPAAESDLKDRYLRLAAEFDNFRKRTIKEKAEYVKFANENLIRELLPVLDNFERALAHAGPETDPASLAEGVKLILSQIQTSLGRFGVRAESALGKPFDPLMHEAVSHVPSAEHPPHTVIDEIQKAYFLHDRLIRPALVTVSKETGVGDDSGQQMN